MTRALAAAVTSVRGAVRTRTVGIAIAAAMTVVAVVGITLFSPRDGAWAPSAPLEAIQPYGVLIQGSDPRPLSDAIVVFAEHPELRDVVLETAGVPGAPRTEADDAFEALGPVSALDFRPQLRDVLHRREYPFARWYAVHPHVASVALERCSGRVFLDRVCHEVYLGALVAGVVPPDYSIYDDDDPAWKRAVRGAESRIGTSAVDLRLR